MVLFSTMEILQLQYTDKVIDVSFAGPALECRRGVDSRVPQLHLVVFLGPCTQVQGPGLCPQGHGPHN